MRSKDDAKAGETTAQQDGDLARGSTSHAPRDTDAQAATAAALPISHGDGTSELEGAETMASGERDAPDTETTQVDSDDLIGTVIRERYRVVSRIGQGGMGAVYEAEHMALGKPVAIKVLLDKYAKNDPIVARLEQEARLASSIGHDNIIDITDIGVTASGRTFVVMEFLEGESLGMCLSREGPLQPDRALHIGRQLASALGAAHNKGIVHRDIKPENVFLRHSRNRDHVKVLDFGISKSMKLEEGTESPRLTQTGMVLGTPLYMSPEQARGDEELDNRIDIYAVGVLLFEMVTGEVPFTGKNYLSILSQVMSDPPPLPREKRPELSEDFESVILKALAKDREERYQSMEELDADLAQLQSDSELGTTGARITASRWRKRRKRRDSRRIMLWVVATVATACLVVIAVSLMMGDDKGEDKKAVVPPPPADAAVVVPAKPDAAPAVPAFELAKIRIESKPNKVTVFRGNLVIGTTPFDWTPEKTKEEITLYAEKAGYHFGEFKVKPIIKDGETLNLVLRKPKRGAKPKQRDKTPKGGDKGNKREHLDGDGALTNPYSGGN